MPLPLPGSIHIRVMLSACPSADSHGVESRLTRHRCSHAEQPHPDRAHTNYTYLTRV